jgi:hypothetical protein
MNIYLQRACKDQDQADAMAEWLCGMIGHAGVVISSPDALSLITATAAAKALGSHVETTTDIDDQAEIDRIAQQSTEVLIVKSDAMIRSWDDIESVFAVGAIAAFRGDGQLQWLATPAIALANREVVEAAHALAFSLHADELQLDEAGKSYYYDEREVKRWVLDDGGKSGNCEDCEENADQGWVDMDETFIGSDGDVDEPPSHPNCDCTVENKTQRYRVYESGRRVAV